MLPLTNILSRISSYVLTVTLLSGCAASVSDTAGAPYQSTAFYLPSPIGPIAITVTNAADTSLPKDQSEKWLKELWSAGFGPLALLGGPFAGALVLGSGLILTMGGIGYGVEKSEYNAIVRGLTESNFPELLKDAMRTRSIPSATVSKSIGQALVVIQGFGLFADCFIAAAELSVDRDNGRILNEPLRLTIDEPSADAPPVQCADLSRFAADNGRLIRETARDYAEVFAVMITKRLSEIQ
jgi:hypothetical protein